MISTATHSSLGKIIKMQPMDKGYIKMVLAINIPFKTIHLTFNVWNKQKLQYGNVELKNEDFVVVSYHYKEKYTQLDELIKIERIDNCPLCYCNLEPTDSQRFDCPGCATISDDDVKERVNDRMKLVSCSVKEYQYSPGYKLEFINEIDQSKFVGVVFKNSPMFDDLSLLRESETYHVVGWTNKDNFKCHPLDIVSIYTDGVNV